MPTRYYVKHSIFTSREANVLSFFHNIVQRFCLYFCKQFGKKWHVVRLFPHNSEYMFMPALLCAKVVSFVPNVQYRTLSHIRLHVVCLKQKCFALVEYRCIFYFITNVILSFTPSLFFSPLLRFGLIFFLICCLFPSRPNIISKSCLPKLRLSSPPMIC